MTALLLRDSAPHGRFPSSSARFQLPTGHRLSLSPSWGSRVLEWIKANCHGHGAYLLLILFNSYALWAFLNLPGHFCVILRSHPRVENLKPTIKSTPQSTTHADSPKRLAPRALAHISFLVCSSAHINTTHAQPLHPATLSHVSYGIVKVRVRFQ